MKSQDIDATMDFNATFLSPKMRTRMLIFFDQYNKKPINDLNTKLATANKDMETAMNALEGMLTRADTKFLNGNNPSIADIQVCAQT